MSFSGYWEAPAGRHPVIYRVAAWWLIYPAVSLSELRPLLSEAINRRFHHQVIPLDLQPPGMLAAELGGEITGCVGVDVTIPGLELFGRWRR